MFVATCLLFICNSIDFEQLLCKMLKTKKDTRSATTNFGKEEVLIIQEGGRGLGKELILYYCIALFEKSASPLCPSPFSAPLGAGSGQELVTVGKKETTLSLSVVEGPPPTMT